MDLILGQFADENIDLLSDEELDVLEALMAINDRDLVQWVTNEVPVPAEFDTVIFRRVCAYKQCDH